jgi:hypothetical protein
MPLPYSSAHTGPSRSEPTAYGELLYATVLGLTLMALLTIWWWYVMR